MFNNGIFILKFDFFHTYMIHVIATVKKTHHFNYAQQRKSGKCLNVPNNKNFNEKLVILFRNLYVLIDHK